MRTPPNPERRARVEWEDGKGIKKRLCSSQSLILNNEELGILSRQFQFYYSASSAIGFLNRMILEFGDQTEGGDQKDAGEIEEEKPRPARNHLYFAWLIFFCWWHNLNLFPFLKLFFRFSGGVCTAPTILLITLLLRSVISLRRRRSF